MARAYDRRMLRQENMHVHAGLRGSSDHSINNGRAHMKRSLGARMLSNVNKILILVQKPKPPTTDATAEQRSEDHQPTSTQVESPHINWLLAQHPREAV